jgi:hypothetical protein
MWAASEIYLDLLNTLDPKMQDLFFELLGQHTVMMALAAQELAEGEQDSASS